MKNFFKYMLATISGILALQFIGLIIFFIVIAAASSKSDAPDVKENSVLVVKFNSPVSDRADDNPFSQLMTGGFMQDNAMGLDQILKDIEKAKTDDNISGIFMRLANVPIGYASLEEIRDALVDFKESGKFIVSHSDTYTHKSYYLASVSDSIYLTPTGSFNFTGLSGTVMFYKRAMEKYGVDMQVIRHGTFKASHTTATEAPSISKASALKVVSMNFFLFSSHTNWSPVAIIPSIILILFSFATSKAIFLRFSSVLTYTSPPGT